MPRTQPHTQLDSRSHPPVRFGQNTRCANSNTVKLHPNSAKQGDNLYSINRSTANVSIPKVNLPPA